MRLNIRNFNWGAQQAGGQGGQWTSKTTIGLDAPHCFLSMGPRGSCYAWCDGSSDRSFMVDPLSYFSFQTVLHDWCNEGRGMWYVLTAIFCFQCTGRLTPSTRRRKPESVQTQVTPTAWSSRTKTSSYKATRCSDSPSSEDSTGSDVCLSRHAQLKPEVIRRCASHKGRYALT